MSHNAYCPLRKAVGAVEQFGAASIAFPNQTGLASISVSRLTHPPCIRQRTMSGFRRRWASVDCAYTRPCSRCLTSAHNNIHTCTLGINTSVSQYVAAPQNVAVGKSALIRWHSQSSTHLSGVNAGTSWRLRLRPSELRPLLRVGVTSQWKTDTSRCPTIWSFGRLATCGRFWMTATRCWPRRAIQLSHNAAVRCGRNSVVSPRHHLTLPNSLFMVIWSCSLFS